MPKKPTYEELEQRVRELEKAESDRSKAEKDLWKSDDKIRNLVESTKDWVWEIDGKGVHTYSNDALSETLGYSATEIMGSNEFPLMHPDDRQHWKTKLPECVAQNTGWHNEPIRWLSKSGETRWFESSASPVCDIRGTVIGFRGIDRDITDRMRIQSALEKRIVALTHPLDNEKDVTFEDLFNLKDIQSLQDQFAAATGVASIITTTNGKPITRPSNFCRLCNDIIRKTDKGLANCFKSDAVLGKANPDGPTIQPCLSGGLWDAGAGISVSGKHIANWLIGQVRDETQTDEQMRGYAKKIGADEEAVIEAFHEVPAMSREKFGMIARVLHTLANQLSEAAYQNIQQARFISEKQRAEAALKESKDFLDNMSDIAYTADDQGNISWVNPAIERVTGFSPEEIIGKPFLPLFVEADHASLMDVYERTMGGESLENTLTFTSGVTCHFTSLPKRDFQGNTIGTFGVARDISKQVAVERSLVVSEARLKKAQAMASMGNWEYDIATGKVWGSDEAFRIYGLERTSEFLPLDEIESYIIDAQSVNQALVDLIVQNKPYDIEFQLKANNKAGLTHIHSVADLVNDRDGKPVKVVGVIQDITAYRRLETEKNQSDETYRNLLGNLNAGVVVHTPDTSIRIANPMACSLLGLSENQMLGKMAADPCWKFLRDDGSDMPLDEYPVNRVLAEDGLLRNLVVGVKRSEQDDVVWLLVNGFASTNDSNQVEQVIISFVDITERKRAEMNLHRSVSLLNATLESTADGILVVDRDGKVEGFNQKFLDMWHIPETVARSRDDDTLIAHVLDQLKEPENFTRKVKQMYAEPDTSSADLISFKDGRIFERYSHPQMLAEKVVGRVWSFRDITVPKRTELALKESEERFKALHNASFGGIAIHDKGLILECNKGLSEMTGYAYDELIGMNGLLLISDDTRDKVVQNIEAGYEKSYEATGVRKNGERYPVQLEARNIPYRGQDVRVVKFRDITASKRAEKERQDLEGKLRQAQKMEAVGRLAGGVAHDFNNMLSVILGHAEMAMEDMDPSLPLYSKLQEIGEAGRRSADLTRQLLGFARKQTISPKVIDLNKAVSGMLGMLKRILGENIDLAWVPGEDLWPVKMDQSQIDQTLANLCVNARDAIADVGKITIETATTEFDKAYCDEHTGFIPGEYVVLAVSDSGSGMDAETMSNIFEPFFTTKKSGKGTGLGLATVYGVVKQNNGFINVYSEPGQGTTFRIYLPRHRTRKGVVTEKVEQHTAARGHETILLVEDEIAILLMTSQMLQNLGYQVVEARTPGEAIRLAQEYRGEVDLLLTDVIMPEMNGRDLARSILSMYPDLKRLFMSGYTANVIAHHGVLDEGVNFIQKPFSSSQLGGKVRDALDNTDDSNQH